MHGSGFYSVIWQTNISDISVNGLPTTRYKAVQMETIGKQIDCIFAFLGFTIYIAKEVHVPPTLDLYLRKDLMVDFVGYLQARGVGR